MIGCKCIKKYHVHILDTSDLVDYMSEHFKQGHKDVTPPGMTQRYLNFINEHELVNFERGHKEWLVKSTHTPPIDSPLSARSSIETTLNTSTKASPLDSLKLHDDNVTEFVTDCGVDDTVVTEKKKSNKQSSSSNMRRNDKVKSISPPLKQQSSSTKIPRKTTGMYNFNRKVDREVASNAKNPDDTTPSKLKNTSSAKHDNSKIDNNQRRENVGGQHHNESRGGRRNDDNYRRENEGVNYHQEPARDDRSNWNRGGSNRSNDSYANNRIGSDSRHD